jgi:hypothetical protein
VLLASLLVAASSAGEVSAITGACKHRASYSSAWQPNGLTFEQCKARNQATDRDDVFEERGLVWWDVRG